MPEGVFRLLRSFAMKDNRVVLLHSETMECTQQCNVARALECLRDCVTVNSEDGDQEDSVSLAARRSPGLLSWKDIT